MKSSIIITLDRSRAETVGALRRLLPRMDSVAPQTRTLAFGIPALDSHLPGGGLTLQALHEVIPQTDSDRVAAFGFAAALLGRVPPKGPVLLVTSSHDIAAHGRPYGHGLHRLGLDPARVILVKTAAPKQTLWAMEEALRSGVPAAVGGSIETLPLKASQRLNFSAGEAGVPLVALRPAGVSGSSVSATRWRVAAALAVRDRFGLIDRWRWRLTLERCRNGRTGEWLVEFDDAYRFSLAAAMADPAISSGAGPPSILRAG